ncbi:MAG: hypothetical protein HQL67_06340 [Magnetococcales bacterium]|nr:hypothetical protein [Magnetococcales bacterium]
MNLDRESILWIAWGSALIIPIKIWLLTRYIRKKMAADEMAAKKLPPDAPHNPLSSAALSDG